jgi:hypothetical protein
MGGFTWGRLGGGLFMLILLVRMVLMFRGPLGYDENGREIKADIASQSTSGNNLEKQIPHRIP